MAAVAWVLGRRSNGKENMKVRSNVEISIKTTPSSKTKERLFAGTVSSRKAHWVLLIIGTLFLLIGAFHQNIWFDESYSVGIARHSFAEIWSIGSNDVHPVLFYWALHCLYLVFGENILVYRLFAVAGSVALAVLGLTHVRRDFGNKAGFLFSFFVFTTPYIAQMAVEIRMYSWVTFAVMVCFLYALRIVRCIRERGKAIALASAKAVSGSGSGESQKASGGANCLSDFSCDVVIPIPIHWWLIFFVSSLASAYLQYFGAVTAFFINLWVLGYLIAHRQVAKRPLCILLLGEFVQVLVYLPWLLALIEQMSVVSGSYWAEFTFPGTVIELLGYSFYTSALTFAAKENYGTVVQVVAIFLLIAFLFLSIAVLVLLGKRELNVKSERAGDGNLKRKFDWKNRVFWKQASMSAFILYVLVVLFGIVASIAMDQLILYFRYLFVAYPLLLFSAVLLLVQLDRSVIAGVTCAVAFGLALLNQAIFVYDNYSSANDEPLHYFAATVNECANAHEIIIDQTLPCYEGEKSTQLQTRPLANDTQDQPLVLSSDIGVMGVTSILYPDIKQTYLDWQEGNWAEAYRAYEPALTSIDSWDDALSSYSGKFVVIGQSCDGSTPKDIEDIAARPDVTMVSSKTFYRPYERTYFTIAVMER